MSSLAPGWLEKFPFDAKVLTPLGDGLVAVSGGVAGLGVYDLAARRFRWFHERYYFWDRGVGVHDGTICAPTRGGIHFFELATGKLLSSLPLPHENSNEVSPVQVGGDLHVINKGNVQVIDIARRKKKATHKLVNKLDDSDFTVMNAVWHQDRLWVFCKKGKQSFVEAVGEAPVSHALPKGVVPGTGPVALADSLYFGGRNGHFYGVDCKTGKLTLDVSLFPGASFAKDDDGPAYTRPIVHQGKLAIFACEDQEASVFVIDPGTGKLTADTLNTRDWEVSGNLHDLWSSPGGIIGINTWHDVFRTAGGKFSEWFKLSEKAFESIADCAPVQDGERLVLLVTHKARPEAMAPLDPKLVVTTEPAPAPDDDDDDKEKLMAGIVCLGGPPDPSLGAAVDMKQQEARRIFFDSWEHEDLEHRLREFDRALAVFPRYPRILEEKASVLFTLERKAEALKVARAALAIDPDDQRVQAVLRRISA